MLEIACFKRPYISLLYCKFTHCHWKPRMPYYPALVAEQTPYPLLFPSPFLSPPVCLAQGLGLNLPLQCTAKSSPSPIFFFFPRRSHFAAFSPHKKKQKGKRRLQMFIPYSLTTLGVFSLTKVIYMVKTLRAPSQH